MFSINVFILATVLIIASGLSLGRVGGTTVISKTGEKIKGVVGLRK